MRILPGKPATFSLSDVCEWSAATATQVEHWVRNGVIVPFQESAGRGTSRVFNLQNVIEAALARELASAGLSVQQLQVTFSNLRATLAALPAELRASGLFVRYTEMMEAIVTITGPGPSYLLWKKDCEAMRRSWARKQEPLDERILNILAGARAAERAAGGTEQAQ